MADNMLIEELNQKINELSCEIQQNHTTLNIYKEDIEAHELKCHALEKELNSAKSYSEDLVH
jgi:chromosome segregation ATPase